MPTRFTDLFMYGSHDTIPVIPTACVTLLHSPSPNYRYLESTSFTLLIENAWGEQLTSWLYLRHLADTWQSLSIPMILWKTFWSRRLLWTKTATWSRQRVKIPKLTLQCRAYCRAQRPIFFLTEAPLMRQQRYVHRIHFRGGSHHH